MPSPFRARYEAKRRQLMRAGANFIVIDLLRTHPRLIPADSVPENGYYALVNRAPEQPDAGLWTFGVRDPLPKIPVPLRPPDADAVLDLRAVLDATYAAAGYAAYIYDRQPDPPLSPDDAPWAQKLLPARPD